MTNEQILDELTAMVGLDLSAVAKVSAMLKSDKPDIAQLRALAPDLDALTASFNPDRPLLESFKNRCGAMMSAVVAGDTHHLRKHAPHASDTDAAVVRHRFQAAVSDLGSVLMYLRDAKAMLEQLVKGAAA
jgi:hypothetical protein